MGIATVGVDERPAGGEILHGPRGGADGDDRHAADRAVGQEGRRGQTVLARDLCQTFLSPLRAPWDQKIERQKFFWRFKKLDTKGRGTPDPGAGHRSLQEV